jgi:hypothetical protein
MNKAKQPIQTLSNCVVPRNFILLDSIDRANDFSHVTYGLMEDSEQDPFNHVTMKNWKGSMIYDDGRSDLLIFELTFECTKDFPNEAPIITFSPYCLENTRVANICDDDGKIKKEIKIDWNNKTGVGEYLVTVLNKIRRC